MLELGYYDIAIQNFPKKKFFGLKRFRNIASLHFEIQTLIDKSKEVIKVCKKYSLSPTLPELYEICQYLYRSKNDNDIIYLCFLFFKKGDCL